VSRFLSLPISLPFPGYEPFRVVISDGTDDDTRWLAHWVICGFALRIESALSLVVAHFPFYYEIKCAGLLLLLQTNDARPAYRPCGKVLAPLLARAKPHVNAFPASRAQQATVVERKAPGAAMAEMVNVALKQ